VLFPAMFLVPTVLAISLLGDGLRDVLDPKFAKR
jgi:peptide/nickel transport system permease protein